MNFNGPCPHGNEPHTCTQCQRLERIASLEEECQRLRSDNYNLREENASLRRTIDKLRAAFKEALAIITSKAPS